MIYYPMSTYPFYQNMVNISFGYDRRVFDIPFMDKNFYYYKDFQNLPPIVPLQYAFSVVIASNEL